MKPIYVDHAATSPMHPLVVETMLPYFTNFFGNPSSIHQFGRKARQAVDCARAFLAHSIHALNKEIIFTSGGTESDNLAIIGYANANRHKGNHIVTTQIEHHALLHTCAFLEKQGFEITYLPVDEKGRVSIEDVKQAIKTETILVSVMFGNNEVGTVQPISEIGQFLYNKDIAFHTDAVQAYGVIPIDVKKMGIDLLSVSGHKINGPKGIGFLYVNSNIKISPFLFGGEQERKRRAGTENVAAIVGMMQASKISLENRETNIKKYHEFRKEMIKRFNEGNIAYKINGDEENFLPHIFNVSFEGVGVESLLVNLDLAHIAASSGSACTAGSLEPSHVLKAMYQNNERMMNSIRFSFGYGNTLEEMKQVANETINIINRIKGK